jgi:hypothetical protein
VRARSAVAAALVLSPCFLLLFFFTLLPGLEFGDSPSFQTMAGSPVITPRDGYPLYYGVARAVLWVTGADQAYTLNLASAVAAAIACGLVTIAATELTGSAAAGAAAAALFGGSYTFWSQSIIAEVYALHILLIALTLLLLLRWERQPTTARLAAFLGAYALSFGNHLSMILLLPAYAGFVLARAPGGWRSTVRPSIVALALLLATAGAAQYVWNFRGLWLWPSTPSSLRDALATFWFDVTKADWRDTMVLRVPMAAADARLQMYWFDLRQQFGVTGAAFALAGALPAAHTSIARFWLLMAMLVVNLLFALGYNVGDAHVFFLPSHLVLAIFAAAGAVWLDRLVKGRGAVVAVLFLLAGVRIYENFPALDRSADQRPRRHLDAMTDGLDDRSSILLADLNWQVQNGLTYYASKIRPEVAYARLADVMLFAPALVRDNLQIGREVVATERAKEVLDAAYGPLFEFEPDRRTVSPSLAETAAGLPAGARYALTLLRPSPEFTLNRDDVSAAVRLLTGGRKGALGDADYVALAGVVGRAPEIDRAGARPFRVAGSIDGIPVEVRMESWLAFDTIRRMGFGHVIARRRHTLIVERGVSFAAFDADGIPVKTAYLAGIYAPSQRFLVRLRGESTRWR